MSTHRASTSSSGGFRAVAPKPPVHYQRIPAEPPTTVGERVARQGWPAQRPGPAHTPPRGQRPVRTGDGRALTALRVVTYVLCSLASLLFILLVVYAGLRLAELGSALPGLGLGG